MFTDVSLPLGLSLREIQLSDQDFAVALFASTRSYLDGLPLSRPQLDALIRQQFLMQQDHYAKAFPLAVTYIIEHGFKPIGKIILLDAVATLHVVDLALVDDMRGKGFGSIMLRALKAIAQQQGRPLRLAVDANNIAAKKLYARLGFKLLESSTTHEVLLW